MYAPKFFESLASEYSSCCFHQSQTLFHNSYPILIKPQLWKTCLKSINVDFTFSPQDFAKVLQSDLPTVNNQLSLVLSRGGVCNIWRSSFWHKMSFEKYSNAKASEGPKRTTKQNMQKDPPLCQETQVQNKGQMFCPLYLPFPKHNRSFCNLSWSRCCWGGREIVSFGETRGKRQEAGGCHKRSPLCWSWKDKSV